MTRIVTTYDPPPIPVRNCDWSATRDSYDAGDPIGWGRTREEAVADLEEQLADRACEYAARVESACAPARIESRCVPLTEEMLEVIRRSKDEDDE